MTSVTAVLEGLGYQVPRQGNALVRSPWELLGALGWRTRLKPGGEVAAIQTLVRMARARASVRDRSLFPGPRAVELGGAGRRVGVLSEAESTAPPLPLIKVAVEAWVTGFSVLCHAASSGGWELALVPDPVRDALHEQGLLCLVDEVATEEAPPGSLVGTDALRRTAIAEVDERTWRKSTAGSRRPKEPDVRRLSIRFTVALPDHKLAVTKRAWDQERWEDVARLASAPFGGPLRIYRAESGDTFLVNEGDVTRLLLLAEAQLRLGRLEAAESSVLGALETLNRQEVRWLSQHEGWWCQAIDTLGTIEGLRTGVSAADARLVACRRAEAVRSR